MARRIPRPITYDASLLVLASTNAGAREAIVCGMTPEAVLHYAFHWPHGIGREPQTIVRNHHG